MNDKRIDTLIETAKGAFVNELGVKIIEMEELFASCKDECSEADTKRLLRFFHSINGTASTVKLDYISSIGKRWERKIKDLTELGHKLNKATLQEALMAINVIKEEAESINEKSNGRNIHAESNEYANIPDRGKILLVDDDITILKLLENAFTMEGYTVYICEDSASTMDTIADTRPDIIILDIIMPKLNGYEVMGKIKSRPEYSDIHIIFLSAKGDVDDKIKGLKSGADDYITKPFAIGEITTKVEMIMRRSKNYKEKLLRDSLTDAYSRYYFNFRIAEELERYRRNGSAFCVAFIDMDHYKYINDQYGHQTGDYVLKEFVSYIAGNIRECDSIYRYGGEEFILLLPDTTKEKAYMAIDRLRHGFSKEPLAIGGSILNVTFSAGIRQVCDKNESVDEIIDDADKAMYYSKKCGRNKVTVYNEEISTQSLKKTLLIVDDESAILRLLKDRLSCIGYNVITAKDGSNAVQIAQEVHPDAIVLDLILPDIDGFEVCKQIKEDILTRSSKIIMLSKKKHKKSVVKGLYCGADDYVTKPFSMSELEARIMRVLNSTS